MGIFSKKSSSPKAGYDSNDLGQLRGRTVSLYLTGSTGSYGCLVGRLDFVTGDRPWCVGYGDSWYVFAADEVFRVEDNTIYLRVA